MNTKKIVALVGLIALTGTSSWSNTCDNLIEAAKNGDLNKLNQALNNKNCVETRDQYGFTALMWAADYHNDNVAAEMVAKLIKKANSIHYINAVSKDGFTALSQAAVAGNDAVVEVLISAGADTKKTLFDAIKNGRRPEGEAIEIIDCLKKHNIDMNETDDDDWTPLMWAALKGKLAITEALLKNGAKKSLTNNDRKTALDIALNASQYKIVSALQK